MILRELCFELTEKGIQTDRFTELWIASGVQLDDHEFEMANRILQKLDEPTIHETIMKRTYH